MKRYITKIMIGIMLLSTNAFCSFEARKISDYWYTWSLLEYQKFETQIKVQGLFYETSITMIVKLGKYYDWYDGCISAESGLYEFIWLFYLPDESVITACQMWDEAQYKYISAQLIDLSTAEETYDPNSQAMPNLLLREYRNRDYSGSWDHFYLLKIAPVDRDEVKEVIIRFLTPCRMYWDVRRIGIYSRQFYEPWELRCNNNAPAEFRVIDYDNPEVAPRNVWNMGLSWQKNGDFWYAKTGPYNPNFETDSILRVNVEHNSGKFLQIYETDSIQFYQIATLPHIQFADLPARHIIIACDLSTQEYYYSDWSRDNTIDRLKWPLLIATSARDSIAFVTSDFNVRWLDQEFVPRTSELIEQRLSQVLNIKPKLSTLPFMLREAVHFLNERDLAGEIWFISNGTKHSDPAQTAMDIVQQTFFQAKKPVKFRIIDAAFGYSPYYYINNKYYSGNEYLYENLYRLSKGNLASLRNFYAYDRVDAMLDCLAPMVSSVEIDPLPNQGLGYSRYSLNFDRKNFNITSRYFEIGLFKGEAPFTINYFGNYLNELYHKEFTFDQNTAVIPAEMAQKVKPFWYSRYINDLLEQPQSYATITYIEQLSVENQILTPYSGFVIPGPNGYIGFQKLVAADSILSKDESPGNEDVPLPDDFTISSFPNPFNPTTTIIIDLPLCDCDQQFRVRIYNIRGQTMKTYDLDKSANQTRAKIVWDGLDESGQSVASGVYVVTLKARNVVRSHKITLLR